MNVKHRFTRYPGVALYQQIKDMLRAEIAQMHIGEQILSEQHLMQRYGVSRGPIRQAVTELVYEGVLYRVQGKGTFRAGATVNHANYEVNSLTEQLLRGGMTPGIRDVALESVIPPPFVSQCLQTDEKTEVWQLSRVRLSDGEPVTYSRGYIPKDIIPNLAADELKMSIVNMLRDTYGIVMESSRSLCTARNADALISEKLNINIGDAVLHIEFVAANALGRPILADITEANGQKYVMRIEQR